MQALFARCFPRASRAGDAGAPASRRLLGLDACRGEAASQKDLPCDLRARFAAGRVERSSACTVVLQVRSSDQGEAFLRVTHAEDDGALSARERERLDRELLRVQKLKTPHAARVLECGGDDFCRWVLVARVDGASCAHAHALSLAGCRIHSRSMRTQRLAQTRVQPTHAPACTLTAVHARRSANAERDARRGRAVVRIAHPSSRRGYLRCSDEPARTWVAILQRFSCVAH